MGIVYTLTLLRHCEEDTADAAISDGIASSTRNDNIIILLGLCNRRNKMKMKVMDYLRTATIDLNTVAFTH